MVSSSVTNCRASIKRDNPHETAYELLCAKLKQAQAINDVLARIDLSDTEVMRLLWCLSDLLSVANEQCEKLKSSDLIAAE